MNKLEATKGYCLLVCCGEKFNFVLSLCGDGRKYPLLALIDIFQIANLSIKDKNIFSGTNLFD